MGRTITTAAVVLVCGITFAFFLGMALIVNAMEYMYTGIREGE